MRQTTSKCEACKRDRNIAATLKRLTRNTSTALLLGYYLIPASAHAVEPPSKPQRLISICAQGDQLLLELVDPSRILAVSQLAADPDISAHWEEAQKVPKVAASAEQIVKLKPDLVLAGQYTATLTVNILKRLGIPVLELGVANDFDELRAQIRDVAKTLGETEKAEAIIRQMDTRLERIKSTTPPVRPTAMLYFQDGFTPGAHTFPNAILEAAGFRNLGAELNKDFGVSVSLERIILSRPQFLILTRYREANPTATQVSAQQPIFKEITGNTQVLTALFRDLATPDPKNLDLIEELHRQLLARLHSQENEGMTQTTNASGFSGPPVTPPVH